MIVIQATFLNTFVPYKIIKMMVKQDILSCCSRL